MTVITIPKHLSNKELVLISRKEYEAMRRGELPRKFREVKMTKAQKRDLETARRDYARGDFVTLDVLKRDLECRNSR